MQHHIFAHDSGGRIDSSAISRRATLRKSTKPRLRDSTQHRLDEIVILEISQEGGRQYLNLTVRELYNHVLAAIKGLPHTSHSIVIPWIQQRRAKLSVEGGMVKEDSPNKRNELFDKSIQNLQKNFGSHHPLAKERLGAHLHPRDMRRLVTPFSLSNEPELIVRRHVMLLNFDPLRAIILRDRLLVLVPDGADTLLETIEKRVRGGAAGLESDIFGESPVEVPASSIKEPVENEPLLSPDALPPRSDTASDEFDSQELERDEFEELRRRTWINLPFELQCVDAILNGVTELLAIQALDIQKDALSAMEYLLRPGTGVGTFAQEMLRSAKKNVHGMVSRVNGFVRALTQVLNEDEDMALMNLARLISHPERFVQPVSAQVLEEESDEPELILEAYLQLAVTLTNELESLDGQLHSTEGLMNMKSDTLRNRILYISMLTTTVTMGVTMAVVVSAFFGMNVPIYIYKGDPGFYFKPMIIGSILGSVVVTVLVFALLRRIGILTTAV